MSKFNFNIDIDNNNDNIESLFKSTYVMKSVKQSYIDVYYVDLGLPSGNLWCKYNLGVDPNKLNNPEDWIGDYYAWGELKPNKSFYSLKNYKFSEYAQDIRRRRYTKYTSDDPLICCSTHDNIRKLLPEDNAVIQFYNDEHYDMPDNEDFTELIKNTKQKFIYNFNCVKGLHGVTFTSLNNGNIVFFPAAGYYNDAIYKYDKLSGRYWAKNRASFPNYANYLGFIYNENNNSLSLNIHIFLRYNGFSIRPVYRKNQLRLKF